VEGADGMTCALDVRGVQLRRGTRAILENATFDVAPGEVVAIMGASGSGKTTLLRAIAGLERVDEGSIAVGDVVLTKELAPAATIRRLRDWIGMVFQFHCLFEHLTVIDNICLAPVHVHGTPVAEAAARAADLLRRLGVEHRSAALPRELSGGEAQRVAIARALAVDPPLLLMDEPTASLDQNRRLELANVVSGLVGRDRTLLIATHDEEFARAVATRILRVTDGVVREIA
jgi:ABC-type polar amino acid transport system ATPase subunit